jgi:hypothetical protein
MANYTTGAQRYNARMEKIWQRYWQEEAAKAAAAQANAPKQEDSANG